MKYFLLCVLLLALAWTAFAQEDEGGAVTVPEGKHLAASLGLEGNNNNPHGAALGFTYALDYRLHRYFAAGLRGGFSANFSRSNTVETAAAAYFVIPYETLDFFLYGGIGVSGIFTYETSMAKILLEGGGGVRVPLEIFHIIDYIEGSVRFGYPFLWGAGVMVGKRFQ
jgi:hypothetical protein